MLLSGCFLLFACFSQAIVVWGVYSKHNCTNLVPLVTIYSNIHCWLKCCPQIHLAQLLEQCFFQILGAQWELVYRNRQRSQLPSQNLRKDYWQHVPSTLGGSYSQRVPSLPRTGFSGITRHHQGLQRNEKKNRSTNQLTYFLGPELSHHLFLFRSCQCEKNNIDITLIRFSQGTGETDYDNYCKMFKLWPYFKTFTRHLPGETLTRCCLLPSNMNCRSLMGMHIPSISKWRSSLSTQTLWFGCFPMNLKEK